MDNNKDIITNKVTNSKVSISCKQVIYYIHVHHTIVNTQITMPHQTKVIVRDLMYNLLAYCHSTYQICTSHDYFHTLIKITITYLSHVLNL